MVICWYEFPPSYGYFAGYECPQWKLTAGPECWRQTHICQLGMYLQLVQSFLCWHVAGWSWGKICWWFSIRIIFNWKLYFGVIEQANVTSQQMFSISWQHSFHVMCKQILCSHQQNLHGSKIKFCTLFRSLSICGICEFKIWARSRNGGCLVTWFCYQLIAKPGYKTATVPWPDPNNLLPALLTPCGKASDSAASPHRRPVMCLLIKKAVLQYLVDFFVVNSNKQLNKI